MKASDGRLSPFAPVADDDGLDVLFYDKLSGNSVAIQLKCRTVAIRKRNSEERGNTVHFKIRKATYNDLRKAFLIGALFNEELTAFLYTWLIPMERLPSIARETADKFTTRASKAEASADKYAPYRCGSAATLAGRIIAICEERSPVGQGA